MSSEANVRHFMPRPEGDGWHEIVHGDDSNGWYRWSGTAMEHVSPWTNGAYVADAWARNMGAYAPQIARECGASDEYRVAVLKACIDRVMQKRGAGITSVMTSRNDAASELRRWTAFLRFCPMDVPDGEIGWTDPYAEAIRATEVGALEALATFLGAAR